MNVCFVGDSIVLGVGAPACLGWPGRVCARACAMGTDLICHNLGVRGSTAADIRDHWVPEADRRLPSHLPALLVISFGAADANQNIPFEETSAASVQLLAEAAAKYPTLLVGPPPVRDETVRERVAAVSTMLADEAAGVGIPYLPVFDSLVENPGYMQDLKIGDGVHPGAQGYDAITSLVLEWDEFQKKISGATD